MREIEREVVNYKKAVNTIRTSDNPYFAENEKVQNYEIDKKREELEKRISDIKNQFTDEIDGKIAEYEELAAKSYFKPSETDRKLVSEYISDLLVDSKLAYSESDKLDAFDRFENKLGFLDENGLHEVRKQLPSLFDQLGNDKALGSKLKGHRPLNQSTA